MDSLKVLDPGRKKAGGFDDGILLLQTGILGRDRESGLEVDTGPTQVLARKISGDTYEIPFSFFGFMELDQPRSLVFDDLGVRLDVILKADRIELRVSAEAEQLELPLNTVVDAGTGGSEVDKKNQASKKQDDDQP